EGQPHGGRSTRSSPDSWQPEAVPGAHPSSGVRGTGVSVGPGLVVHNTPTHETLARRWPQFGRQLPGTLRLSVASGGFAASSRRTPPTRLRGEEALGVEDLALAQQVVDGTAQACGQRPQGARLAVLLLAACQPLLGLLALAQEQAGGLAE